MTPIHTPTAEHVEARYSRIAPLTDFVRHATSIVELESNDTGRVRRLAPLLSRLIEHDDWLPDTFSRPHPEHYQQYLLHCDPLERFSVVSFVWGPGQKTPIHDHTVWGLIGMLRGSEISTPYRLVDGELTPGEAVRLMPGDVETLLPERGDIHRVENAFRDRVSISVHVYGANIGKVERHVFETGSGSTKTFVSGFSASVTPNLWE
ncbi:cysteine dioxygenase [Salinicola peritrichatus]|uniref:cysteine dioxygenase family protein n=1 Tax=Salinicola peritrichatus TaxID=1267424 RepID=UPI000DA2573C|nr:cysteine dioxygenase [Salinicola peritrichatus]